MSIQCPQCETIMRCLESRQIRHEGRPAVRRRHRCPDCGEKVYTKEIDSGALDALVKSQKHLDEIYRAASARKKAS